MSSEETTRECRYCFLVQPITEFNWEKKSKGTRHFRCRDCFRIYNRERYEAKGDHVRAVVNAYRTANAELISERRKANYDSVADVARSRAYALAHPEHIKAYKAAWLKADRAANPEKYREKGRRYGRSHPEAIANKSARRRARKLAAPSLPITPAEMRAKWNYWGARCWMCSTDAVEWDHVKPVAHGGGHLLANLRPACRSCNATKQDRWPVSTSSIRGDLAA